MKLNYPVTQELLDAVEPYCNLEKVAVSTDNQDWRGRPIQSDFVMLIEKQNICFEVFDNEIIVGYFSDHTHFEDYSSDLEDGFPNYAERAKEFLVQLFSLPVRHTEAYRGKKLASENYYFVMPDGSEDYLGGSWYGLVRFLNPFAKKHITTTTWKYDKTKGCFMTCLPMESRSGSN